MCFCHVVFIFGILDVSISLPQYIFHCCEHVVNPDYVNDRDALKSHVTS